VPGPANRQHEPPALVVDEQVIVVGLDHVDVALVVDRDALGPREVADVQPALAEGLADPAVDVEHLDARVEGVGDVEVIAREGEVRGRIELARPGAAPAENVHQAPLVVEDLHIVCPRVGNVDQPAARIPGDPGRALEHLGAEARNRGAFAIEPDHHADLGIGDQHLALARSERDADRRGKALERPREAPHPDPLPRLVEHQHRLVADVGDVDAPVGAADPRLGALQHQIGLGLAAEPDNPGEQPLGAPGHRTRLGAKIRLARQLADIGVAGHLGRPRPEPARLLRPRRRLERLLRRRRRAGAKQRGEHRDED
jgi:hypothetical protein